jgi:hypothetical protein
MIGEKERVKDNIFFAKWRQVANISNLACIQLNKLVQHFKVSSISKTCLY